VTSHSNQSFVPTEEGLRHWGEGVPTGSLALDLALGTGGWPRGRVVEVFGPEGTGKTTLLLEAIAHAQQNGGAGAFIDADHGTDPSAGERLGVDVEAMPFLRTSSLEEAFEKVDELVQGGAMDVIALDGLAALLPEGHRRCSRDEVPPSKNEAHQHKVGYFLKTLLGPLSRSRTVLLISNPVVEKLGVFFGNPETTPWETMPLRSCASQRVELKRTSVIKEGEEARGLEVRATVHKNRLAPPLAKVVFHLLFATGVCQETDLLTLGLETHLLTKRGSRLSLDEQVLGTSHDAAVRFLRQDAALAAKLRAAIVERRRSPGANTSSGG
jgi:recombination protein RecA